MLDNKTSCPIASIVMSAAATSQSYFSESIQSCLSQTVSSFELIVIDDGLSEENRSYLGSIEDGRLRIIRNERNLGQSRSVNKGMRVARGKYVIRMDADDIMLPTRIEAETAFMDAHPNVVAAGALAELTSTGRIVPKQRYSPEGLVCALLFGSTLVHPTMIIRRKTAIEAGLWYDEETLYAQDYMFWADALKVGRIALIPELVLRYRVHAGQISVSKRDAQIACARTVQRKIAESMGLVLDDSQLKLLSIFSLGTTQDLEKAGMDLSDIERLTRNLREGAREVLSPTMIPMFEDEINLRVMKFCMRSLRENHSYVFAVTPSFWRAAMSVKNWPRYFSEL